VLWCCCVRVNCVVCVKSSAVVYVPQRLEATQVCRQKAGDLGHHLFQPAHYDTTPIASTKPSSPQELRAQLQRGGGGGSPNEKEGVSFLTFKFVKRKIKSSEIFQGGEGGGKCFQVAPCKFQL